MKIGKRDAAIVFPETGDIELVLPKEENCPEGVGGNVVTAAVVMIMLTSGDEEVINIVKKYKRGFDRKYQRQVKSKGK